jgi:threonine/homoserine/homoserine lactone efflux protein
MPTHFFLGFAGGCISSLPPGPCGLAVIRAALRERRHALATAAGAATGDAIYASLALGGIGALLAEHPSIGPALRAIGGVALVVYGVASLRGTARDEPAGPSRRGFSTGLGLLLANPGVLLTWVGFVGAFLANAAPLDAWCGVVGIGCGSFAGFAVVSRIAHRGGRSHARGIRCLSRWLSLGLVIGGAVIFARFLWFR